MINLIKQSEKNIFEMLVAKCSSFFFDGKIYETMKYKVEKKGNITS